MCVCVWVNVLFSPFQFPKHPAGSKRKWKLHLDLIFYCVCVCVWTCVRFSTVCACVFVYKSVSVCVGVRLHAVAGVFVL